MPIKHKGIFYHEAKAFPWVSYTINEARTQIERVSTYKQEKVSGAY